MSRSDALAAYEKLPLPDTTEEHWRFTDLRGFDPDSFEGAASAEIETMLDLDVAGFATVTADGIEIEKAPDGVTFEPLTDDNERLYSLVGWDEKFAAHNAAMWKHGLLVVVPKGVVLEKPLYVRISATGQTFWRLVVVAEEGARASIIEEYASPSPDTEAYSNAVTELFVEPAAKLEYVSLQNLSQETWHFANHHARVERDAELDWVAGGFGSKRGKTRIQNDLNGRGATSRVTGAYFADGTQHLDYDTFQEHIAPDCESDFAFKGALRDRRDGGVARDDPRGEGRAEDERVPGVPQPHALADDARSPDPGPRDPGERRAVHPRGDGRPSRPRGLVLLDEPRPDAPGSGAPNRARLLPGDPRPDRTRARARGRYGRARGADSSGLGASGACSASTLPVVSRARSARWARYCARCSCSDSPGASDSRNSKTASVPSNRSPSPFVSRGISCCPSRSSCRGATCFATKSKPSSVSRCRTADEYGHHSAW